MSGIEIGILFMFLFFIVGQLYNCVAVLKNILNAMNNINHNVNRQAELLHKLNSLGERIEGPISRLDKKTDRS